MKACISWTEVDRERGRVSAPFDEAPVFAFWDPATDEITFENNPLARRNDACVGSITRWARKIGADVFISADGRTFGRLSRSASPKALTRHMEKRWAAGMSITVMDRVIDTAQNSEPPVFSARPKGP